MYNIVNKTDSIIKDINDYGIDLFITSEYGLCRITIPNKTPTVAFLSTVIVDEKHRHQGIGGVDRALQYDKVTHWMPIPELQKKN